MPPEVIPLAMLALSAASLVLQGAAVVIMVLILRDGRAGHARQAARDAATLSAIERALRVEPGTIARDVQNLEGGPSPQHATPHTGKKRKPPIDLEAERRTLAEWYIRNGYPPPDFAPAGVARNQSAPLDQSNNLPTRIVEIR